MQFKKLNISSYVINFLSIFGQREFKGWGRKKTGRFALWCHQVFGGKLTLFEDGFIRSLGLGVDGSPSFSTVEDDVGIYYDATTPSQLENILSSYDFTADEQLMDDAQRAMNLIVEHNISKYNNSKEVDSRFRINERLDSRVKPKDEELRILVIAQTAGDASLQYGMLDDYTTDDMIDAAIEENPHAKIYLKVHHHRRKCKPPFTLKTFFKSLYQNFRHGF